MHWGDIHERVIDLNDKSEYASIARFLANFDLSFDVRPEYTVALVHNDQIIATGSLDGEVLRNFAIDPDFQGQDLSARIASHLMREGNRRGRYHFSVYTKPENAGLFTAIGFREIGRSTLAALLEVGTESIATHCASLQKITAALPPGRRAALVVNCNPFTLGHQAVISKAAAENPHAVVLVVSEDRSSFPFEARLRLVKAGVTHLGNVTVIPGGKYIVSAATFPGYFTKGQGSVTAQTELDATIFARHIGPALGITHRYFGTEPLDATTNAYNEAMARILPQYGISFELMPRLTHGAPDTTAPISASAVRQALREDKWEDLRNFVPATTYDYLTSDEAKPVIMRLKEAYSRH